MTATLQTEARFDQSTDADDAASTCVRVVEAVAEATDTDPLSMAPLSDVVDADALDSLVASPMEGHVSFEFCECSVTVFGDGAVVVGQEGI